jgi:hypothetical protein
LTSCAGRSPPGTASRAPPTSSKSSGGPDERPGRSVLRDGRRPGPDGLGRAMAASLLRSGHPVKVWNRTAGRADDHIDRGVTLAPTPTAAVAASELTILSPVQGRRRIGCPAVPGACPAAAGGDCGCPPRSPPPSTSTRRRQFVWPQPGRPAGARTSCRGPDQHRSTVLDLKAIDREPHSPR